MNNLLWRYTVLAALCANCSLAFAQKSITNHWLPETAANDAKLTEWTGTPLEKNGATQLEYVFANNDKIFYLGIRSSDKVTNDRIMAGGITLSINTSGAKKNNGPAITFPVRTIWRQSPGPGGKPGYVREMISLDSVRIKELILKLKDIKVSGVKSITDPLIPVFNEEGIRAKIACTRGALVYELSVPLQLLGILPGSAPFTFQVKVNGVPPVPGSDPNAPSLPMPRFPGQASDEEMGSTTYFWGTYALSMQ